MSHDDESRSEREALHPSQRRRYEPPRVLETAEFETLAVTCTRFPGDAECELGGVSNS